MQTRTGLLTIAAALATGACGPDHPTSPSAPDGSAETSLVLSAERETVAVDRAEVVATADLENGGAVTFLDLGDGHIAIAERAPARSRLVSLAMIQDLKATPLEVYLALRQGNAAVPQALLRDHQRLARSRNATISPRLLAPPPSATAGLAYAAGYYSCNPPGNQWISGWKAEYAGKAKYREAAYFPNDILSTTFYPGAPVYYGTNTNSVTYLGACNADAIYDLWLQVHRRIGGKWVMIYATVLEHDQRHGFYSGLPASYRGVVEAVIDGILIEDFGVGAAWTLTPRVASP